MLITEAGIRHWIDNFYGYGSWQAPLWFVAHEDGGGDLPEEVAEKLEYFSNKHGESQPALCEIRDAYAHFTIRWEGPKVGMFPTLSEYRFGKNAEASPVWKNLIAFAHACRGERPPDPLAYQRNHFGMRNEALIRLYPLPSPHNHAWYYSWLDMPRMGFLKSRELYEQHLYPTRIRTVLEKIKTHNPELVLFYGMSNINALKDSVASLFPEAKFKMVKAVKQLVPQYHRAGLGGTVLLITTQIPALRHNRVETGFDWAEFGKQVRIGR